MIAMVGLSVEMDVLLIEDDQVLGKMICRGLVDSGHHCEWITGGERDCIDQKL